MISDFFNNSLLIPLPFELKKPIQNEQISNKINPISEYFDTLYGISTRVIRLAYSSDCTRGIDEPPKEIGKFPFHTILVIDKSM